jgi:hypothetical protein
MANNLKEINLSGKEIEGLPLFFKKIYYNPLTDPAEEGKLMRYNPVFQSDVMRDEYPVRQISKTIDYKLLKTKKKW